MVRYLKLTMHISGYKGELSKLYIIIVTHITFSENYTINFGINNLIHTLKLPYLWKFKITL